MSMLVFVGLVIVLDIFVGLMIVHIFVRLMIVLVFVQLVIVLFFVGVPTSGSPLDSL